MKLLGPNSIEKIHARINSIKNWICSEQQQAKSRIIWYLQRALVLPLQLAVKVSGAVYDRHPWLGWLATVLIVGGSGFVAATAPVALLGYLLGVSRVWTVVIGIIGGVALDICVVAEGLELAAN